MNPLVNRSAESPHPSGNSPPNPSERASQTQPSTTDEFLARNVPIPPPNHPRQYRAIGLIEGQYQQSDEQMTRGILTTTDGTAIDAVLLGRIISLVKNHLDLAKPHLWVVYPRTRQTSDRLHVQIVGVWEPETLSRETLTSVEPASEALPPMQNGYFSLRGEVIYASPEKKTIIVKIRQSPKKDTEKAKFFKIKLKGTLSDRPVGHFWDLHAQLQQDILTLQTATDLGFVIKKKPPLSGGRPFKAGGQRRFTPSDRLEPPSPPRKAVEKPRTFGSRKPLPRRYPDDRNSETDNRE